MPSLVSIIIPTYNRASFLKETITSIQQQTYTHWECIIVDDGSTDNSMAVLKKIQVGDSRILVFEREKHQKKGGNTCRNIGIEKAQGVYLQFFDSDDLMQPTMLEEKVKILEANPCDYVISKTESFQHPDSTHIIDRQDAYYTFDHYAITHTHYVTQKINWLTPDFMGKSSLFKELRFHTALPSGQEYNLFSKLTLKSQKGIVLDRYTTLRRMHEDSIRGVLTKDTKRLQHDRAILYKETYKELQKANAPKEGLSFLIKKMGMLYLKDTPSRAHLFFIFKELLKIKGWVIASTYVMYQLSATIAGKGYSLKKKVVQSL